MLRKVWKTANCNYLPLRKIQNERLFLSNPSGKRKKIGSLVFLPFSVSPWGFLLETNSQVALPVPADNCIAYWWTLFASHWLVCTAKPKQIGSVIISQLELTQKKTQKNTSTSYTNPSFIFLEKNISLVFTELKANKFTLFSTVTKTKWELENSSLTVF